MSAVDDIKSNIDIVDLISETVKLRRTGRNYIGFCPFHANTHTPAFVVFPDSGSWRCFGQCDEGGDIFSFVMKKEGWDFQQALEYLAKRAGVTLDQFQKEDPTEKARHERLTALMEDAAAWFHSNLKSPAGKKAYEYLLQKRGMTPETIESFLIGYAPLSWDAAQQHLLSKGYSRQELIDTGLVSEKRDESGQVSPDGKIFDRFRNRITIPIRNSKGELIAFGARILDPNDSPKFLNSPQTELFDKGKTLFGLYQARQAIREKGFAVIVEGYMDVIILHQAGFANTVSPMGTALTPFQVKQLSRHTHKILLALDPDAAGENATMKGIDTIRSVLRTGGTASGTDDLIITGGKLDADIRITRLPSGIDPDEVVLKNPADWQQILDQAKPIILFMMETLAVGHDLNDARTKGEIAEKVMPLIYEVANPIERETYRQQLAQFLHIDESLLIYSYPKNAPEAAGPKAAARNSEPEQAKPEKIIFDPNTSIRNKEIAIMHTLFNYYDTPGSIAVVDRTLREYELDPINPDDFDKSDIRQIAAVYFQGLSQDEELDTREYIRKHVSESVRDEFSLIDDDHLQKNYNQRDMDEELTRFMAYLRQEKTNLKMNELQALYQDMEKNKDSEAESFEKMLFSGSLARRRLDKLLDHLNRKVFE